MKPAKPGAIVPINRQKLNKLIKKAKKEGWDRWIRTERDERAVFDGCVFCKEKANNVYRFIEGMCRLTKGPQQKQLIRLLPWHKEQLLGPLFGWIRADQTRRYRRAWVEVPKKNNKSTIGACVGHYLLFADGEPGARIYTAATKKDQAAIVHNDAIAMRDFSPELKKRSKVHRQTKTITYLDNLSTWEVLAYDAGGSEGPDMSGLICDEVHAWKGRAFWDTLEHSGIARRQPLHFVITTAGVVDGTSLGYQEHNYAKDVQSGAAFDPGLFVFIAAADPEDDFLDPEVHKKANPSYGVTIKPEEIMQAAMKAKYKKSSLVPFLRYRLNIWCDSSETFFDMRRWDACYKPFHELQLLDRVAFGGLDLASKLDIAAWSLLFKPLEGQNVWHWLVRYYCPREGAAKRQETDGIPYLDWGRDSWIKLTEGDVIDWDTIYQDILKDLARFNVAEIGADPWNLEYLRQRVSDEFEDIPFIEVGQNFRNLSEPTKELEAMVINGTFAHDGSPVSRWMATNAKVIIDGNDNIRLSKKKSKGKIDGIASVINALARGVQHGKDDGDDYVDGVVIA